MEKQISDESAKILIEALKREDKLQKQKKMHQKAIDNILDSIEAKVRAVRHHLQKIDDIDDAEI